MGTSPLHASTVGLVRNLRTERVSPQFHLVYDDYFETVHSDETSVPTSWPELLTWNTFRSSFDDGATVPALTEDWLSPE